MRIAQFILYLMIMNVARAGEQLVHAFAIDDVYKLTTRNGNGKRTSTYKEYQSKLAAKTVDQEYAKLKKYAAQAMHAENDRRLDAATQLYMAGKQRAVQNSFRLMSCQKEQELASVFTTPESRYEYCTQMRKDLIRDVIMSGSIVLWVVAGSMIRSPNAPSTSAKGFAVMGSGLVALSALIMVDPSARDIYQYRAVMYHLEKRDHARRKELIDRLCKK